MKNIIWIIGAACFLSIMAKGNNYQDGELLSISARSGLKLRALPNLSADVITIMHRGDEVCVIDDFDFKPEMADRISWMDGHWIYVEFNGTRGYVFDGFLTKLPEVEEDNEFCFPCYDLVYALDNYLTGNFHQVGVVDTVHENDYLIRYKTILQGDIELTRSEGEGWFGIHIIWKNQRMSEIVNLFRNMILDKEELKEFERGIIYKEGSDGKINEALINFRSQTIKVVSNAQGDIQIETVISCC